VLTAVLGFIARVNAAELREVRGNRCAVEQRATTTLSDPLRILVTTTYGIYI
jgi:hypothetical protein